MANKLYDEASVQAIANAIRSKNKTETKYKISQMAQAIEDIPAVIKRVTGNPIEFSDGADAPMVKCASAITGYQDLHGYDKPWVGGAGKNKLPLVLADIKSNNTSGTWSDNVYTYNDITFTVNTDDVGNITGIKVNGTASNQAYLIVGNTPINGSYIINGCPQGGDYSNGYSMYITGIYIQDVGSGGSFTATDTSYEVRILVRSGVVCNNLMFYPMIRLSTVTDSTFAPYSNICPITAYTEGEIEVRGKNILDGSKRVKVSANSVNYYGSGDYLSMKADTYTISPSDSGLYTFYVYDENDTRLEYKSNVASCTFTLSSDTNVRFNMYRSSGIADTTDFQIEKGSTATAYEPYTSTTHTTTYPSAIYRGSEDCVKGSVETEWKKIVFDGSNDEGWQGFTILDNVTRAAMVFPNSKGNAISNYLPYLNNYSSDTLHFYIYNNALYVFLPVQSSADFRTYLSTNNLEIAYELTTPTTSSVTPTNLPIKSLSGYNHIESSTGEMTIDYITEGYQNFVDTTTRALSSTRKGGSVSAMDIFLSLDTLEETTSSEPIKTEENNNSEDNSDNIEETR